MPVSIEPDLHLRTDRTNGYSAYWKVSPPASLKGHTSSKYFSRGQVHEFAGVSVDHSMSICSQPDNKHQQPASRI